MDKTSLAMLVKDMMNEVLHKHGLDTLRNDIKKDMDDLKKTVNGAFEIGKEAKDIAEENKKDICDIKTELDSVKAQLMQEKEARLKSECYSRRDNLRFVGIPEEPNEQPGWCERKVLNIINTTLQMDIDNIMIERCHRLGPKTGKRPRDIIIKFSHYKDREEVWGKVKLMQGSGYIMKEDFPIEIERKRNILLPSYLAAKRDPEYKKKVKLVIDKMYLKGTQITVDTLSRLPVHLRPENLATKSNDQAVWFWNKASVFSNHYPCKFAENGVEYNCSEQYLMVSKAKHFGDSTAAEKIMKSTNPVEQKQTEVNNFDAASWRRVAPDIMKHALVLKFSQSKDLRQKLLDTGIRHIGEASPHDDFWGCGHKMRDDEIQDPKNWKGKNILGLKLMEVRSELK